MQIETNRNGNPSSMQGIDQQTLLLCPTEDKDSGHLLKHQWTLYYHWFSTFLPSTAFPSCSSPVHGSDRPQESYN